jgi:hypothetical protein
VVRQHWRRTSLRWHPDHKDMPPRQALFAVAATPPI